MAEENINCPTCEGSGVCTVCHGSMAPETEPVCQCDNTNDCVDCYGEGTHKAYASIQMMRLRLVLRQWGSPV